MATTHQQSGTSQHVLTTAKGSGFLAGGSVFELATRFLISLILARALGATGYGLYNLAISAGTIFAGVAALGLADAIAVAGGEDALRALKVETTPEIPGSRPERKVDETVDSEVAPKTPKT